MGIDIVHHQFEFILRIAFDKFYTVLTQNPYLGDFLRSANLQRLKGAQLQNFLDSTGEDEAAFFERFKLLGVKHHNDGLPYVEYRDAFTLLESLLLEEAGNSGNDPKLREAVRLYIERATNASAAGYLECMLDKDIKTLDRQLQQHVDIPAVKDHLHWILHVIFDIRSLNTEPIIEFDSSKCDFGRWITSREARQFFPDEQSRQLIKATHRDIHLTTHNIYRSIAQKNYHKIFIDYIILVRQSMYLYSELNLNVTQRELIEEGAKDPLTGLLNRRLLDEVLQSEAHLRDLTESSFCVAMFDLDHFKQVNDTYGHQTGDAVLVCFADLLRSRTRKTDKLFRYGGEEFLVVLPGSDIKEALRLCDDIRMAFEQCCLADGSADPQKSVSCGVAQYDVRHRAHYGRLIAEADTCLYEAKRAGRNRVVA